MTRILIACDTFKGTAASLEVGDALRRGLGSAAETELVAIADGGDGTLEVCDSLGYERRSTRATGPYGEPVAADFSLDTGSSTAVIEMAAASGLRLVTCNGELPTGLDAARATSAGVGDLILAALDAGARDIVLGIGGSATTDAGAGMAMTLGAVFTDRAGRAVTDPSVLGTAVAADLRGLDSRLRNARFTVVSDVTNPLTGPNGAVAVYGPQKGLAADRAGAVDDALGSFARVVEGGLGLRGLSERPGAGAAGGLGFMALALLDARYASGVDFLLDLAGFDERLARADLVITGEGRLDDQTLSGKAPAGVAKRAERRGIPVVAVCGQDARTNPASGPFRTVRVLTDVEPDVQTCLREPLRILENLGRSLAHDLSALVAGG